MLIRRHQEVYGNTRDQPAIDDNGEIIDFPVNKNNSNSLKFKQ